LQTRSKIDGGILAAKSKCFKRLEKFVEDKSTNRVRYVEVDQAQGQRIDNFLLGLLTGVPRSRVYRLLRKGEVRVNGGRVKATYRLREADRVRIPPVRMEVRGEGAVAPVPRVQARALASSIIHEDADLLVLNKPAGLAVHGGSGIALGIIEALRQMRAEPGLELAHRLDRDTSGCLLIARSPSALRELHAALRERTVKKRYAALVHGIWPTKRNTVRLRLHKYVTPSGERRVRVSDQGKPSRTDFHVVATASRATWVSAFPHTGRTHQIRVHAASSGNPIVGDSKYRPDALRAMELELGIDGLCLHAEKLVLPFRGDWLKFVCSPPSAFVSAWEALS
jgi:23S rRNA pseudouridine955/2504/2580 synthase